MDDNTERTTADVAAEIEQILEREDAAPIQPPQEAAPQPAPADPITGQPDELDQAAIGIQSALGQHQAQVAAYRRELESLQSGGLREDDPAEWAARREDLRDIERRLMGQEQQLQAAAHQIGSQFMQREQAKLQKAIPNWGPDVAQQLAGYLKENGYSDQEIQGVRDSRAVIALHKLMTDARRNRGPVYARIRRAQPAQPEPQAPSRFSTESMFPNSAEAVALRIESLL